MLVIGAGLGYGLERYRTAPVAGAESFVAVINRDATAPALIVRVDLATRIVTVRPVAAERPSDRVFELWYVPDGAGPRSLGIISAANTTRSRLPANAAPESGLLAVSLEPPGGSPTGAPTGPVVYSGRLIRETAE
jgi:anti-sigma-K factor RskA